jgi:DNA-binding MarR family transcriptional regulator
MLSVYLNPPPHTIRNLAEKLNISKPAVCRAIDTMEKWGLVKRKKDEQDKRNVLIQRTVKGSVYLSELGDVIVEEVNKNPQLLGEEQDKKIA